MSKPELKVASTTEIKIEKGVPLPVPARAGQYPFAAMEVGDSCLVPFKDGENETSLRERVSAGVTWACRKNEKRFTTRSVEGGRRVWRIA